VSTDFRLSEKIRASDLLDGRLEKFGIQEATAARWYFGPIASEETSEETSYVKKCLTDGRNFLWVWIDDDGFVDTPTRYLPNGAPGKILRAICEAFDIDIFSEYEPQFWGFDTQEEWDASQDALAKEQEDEFCSDLVKFVLDEPNGISPGTVGECQAQIAKRLEGADPGLRLVARRAELMEKIKALARMLTAYDSDLPQA
jgi:hypothetical protein